MTIVTWIVAALAAALLLPAMVFALECLVAPRRPRASSSWAEPAPFSTAVVVPAHDEAAQIEATVHHLRSQLAGADRLVVVADNCTDRTAEIAQAAGATVLIRRDPERRGKGYALRHALDALAADPPDVVVIIDADCRLEPGALAELGRRVAVDHAPIQAEYLMEVGDDIKSMVSAFAFMVRNRARPRGLARLGLPTHLTGTGMAFPWDILRDAHIEGSHLVEDMMLGLELARRGYPARLCSEAVVRSELPNASKASLEQRSRWEHGQLHTLVTQAPSLVIQGLRTGRADLIGLGLDLSTPPLSFLVLLQLCALGAAALVALAGGSAAPLGLAGLGFGLLAVGVLAAWWKFGREMLPWYNLLAVPAYVLWKIPLYLAVLVGRRTRQWKRTQRASEE